jgi:coproporphyrinogen III oxidase
MLERLKENFALHVKELQDQITEKVKSLDPDINITEDLWERLDHAGKPGGGGRTRAFSGDLIENAGVNTSEVYGLLEPDFAAKIGSTDGTMWASGLSLIIHPKSPRIPTVHANFRMIVAGERFWFGGGADLTPFYPHEEDFRHFHNVWKKACAPYQSYEWMKRECDQYFVNHHRGGEMRGIGGIFFDHFNRGTPDEDVKMVKELSKHFIDSYFPIVTKRQNEYYDIKDEDFQLHRRGRYVEFNLLHDRGTLFGLKTNGRTDSILISLPARCRYTYRYAPEAGSVHEKMQSYYFPHDW